MLTICSRSPKGPITAAVGDGAGNGAELAAWLDSNGGAVITDDCSSVTWTNDYQGLSDDMYVGPVMLTMPDGTAVVAREGV